MSLRTREAGLLVIALLLTATAFATVDLAGSRQIQPHSIGLVLALVVLWGGLHVAARRFLPAADPYLLPATALLGGVGMVTIYRLDEELASKQAVWTAVAVAGALALIVGLRDHHRLEGYKYVIGAGGVLALLITISPLGSTINGARLWIRFAGFQIQPGEFAKIAIVIFLAAYLREKREMLRLSLSPKYIGPLLLFWGASLCLLVLMRDFGTSLLFYGSFLLMVYVATARTGYVLTGVALFAAGSFAVLNSVSHVRDRFDIWLNPWDVQQDQGYQLVQGLFAMADGGLFGRGLGQAYLVTEEGNYVIPDVHTDFVYAALSDELGLLGAVALLLCYVLVAWRGIAIATAAEDGFSKLLAFGLTTVFALQTVIIVGGIVRLVPLTGQTLPFVSYGGSSVVANLGLVTLLMMISHRQRAHTYAVTHSRRSRQRARRQARA